jgi:hypothetical protein
MSFNQSVMMLEFATIKAELSALRSENSELKGMLQSAASAAASAAAAEPSAKKTKTKTKSSAKKEAEDADAEPKAAKAPSAWNVLVAETVADMKQNGWTSWTDLKEVVWPGSRSATVKDKSGSERSAFVFDGGLHDGKEPSPALGGMVRASYLKAQTDPEAAAKARKYHEKLAEKRSAASGSVGEAEPIVDAEEAPAKKKAGRPKMTDEQKAEAKAKKEAKAEKPETAAVPAPEPAAAPAAPATPPAKKSLIQPKAPAKKLDLSFIAWEHKGVMYITNDRGDVVNPDDGTWVGRFDGTDIDETVPEPSDLEAATMRE